MKFLVSILKRKVSSSSVFVSLFIVMTHNSSVNFKVIHFPIWAKVSHQSSNFDTLECSDQKIFMSFSKQQVSFSSNFASFFDVMKDNSSLLFLVQAIYTLLKRNPLKWKSLRLLSAHVKICKIPYVNIETTSWFLSRFCIPLQFPER